MLNCGTNNISEIPESIAGCTQLQTLLAFSNPIASLPLALTNLSELQRVNFKGCPIEGSEQVLEVLRTVCEGADGGRFTI